MRSSSWRQQQGSVDARCSMPVYRGIDLLPVINFPTLLNCSQWHDVWFSPEYVGKTSCRLRVSFFVFEVCRHPPVVGDPMHIATVRVQRFAPQQSYVYVTKSTLSKVYPGISLFMVSLYGATNCAARFLFSPISLPLRRSPPHRSVMTRPFPRLTPRRRLVMTRP